MGADSGHVVHANPSPARPPLTPERHRGVGQDAFHLPKPDMRTAMDGRGASGAGARGATP